MGRLQYVNRKIDGAKLGQVVAKDLLKRLSSTTTHKAALRDPVLDLDISGKELDDEALTAILQALETLLAANCENAVVCKIEEICLAGNLLTSRSLSPLARIIQLAPLELKDVDISHNSISVETQEDLCAWEEFLNSFEKCTVLRRIDLSGNALATKAFEVLAKVYCRHGHEAKLLAKGLPLSGLGKNSVRNFAVALKPVKTLRTMRGFPEGPQIRSSSKASRLDERQGSESLDTERSSEALLVNTEEHFGAKGYQANPSYGNLGAYTGLRSIPYIVLDNTSMNDAGALHLSHVIAEHHLPASLLSLMPPRKAGAVAQQLLEHALDASCRGIMYRYNKSIGSDGLRVLELAERFRDQAPAERISAPKYAAAIEPSTSSLQSTNSRRKAAMYGVNSEVASCATKAQDLGATRSKIQAQCLKANAQGNDLWYAALQMLNLARMVLLHSASDFLDRKDQLVESPGNKIMGVQLTASFERPRGLKMSDTNAAVVPRQYANNVILDRFKNISIIARNCEDVKKPEKLWEWTARTAELLQRRYRSTLLCGFSEDLWCRILAQAADEKNVLSWKQRYKIMDWASRRDTIQQERNELGRPRANQIWLVLHGMGCLAYESDKA